MSYTYKVEAINCIPEGVPLNKEETISTKKEWYGSSWGECVGKILENGENESFFKKDIENKNTNMLDSLINNELCKTIRRNMYNEEKREIYSATYYYFLYRILDHSSEKATVTQEVLNSAMNVKYKYTYEILFVADNEYKRYVTDLVISDGPYTYSLLDVINDFEELFEEWAEKRENGFRNQDGNVELKFYSDIGEELYIGFDSMRELLRSINSIRIIDLQTEIDI